MLETVILIALALFIAILVLSIRSKGSVGEKRVAKELKRLPKEYHVLNDVILETRNGTTQIDHIVISPNAVFVIETKNYTGWIFGKEQDKEWLQTIAHYENRYGETVERTKFLNPIRQNYGHAKAVEALVRRRHEKLPIIPIVVFVGDAVFRNLQCTSNVLHLYELTEVIRDYRRQFITAEEAASLAGFIGIRNRRKEVSNKDHIKNIRKNMQEKAQAASITADTTEQYRVIIAGGRDFSDYELLKEKCDYYLQNKIREGRRVVIISGHASGADSLGERYAQERGLQCEQHPADWKTHGKAAGPIRNAEMAAVADALIAFWDGQSRGTRHMIETARAKGLKVAVVSYQIAN